VVLADATTEAWTTPDGCELVMHHWAPTRPAAVIFYVHGLQSHAGWLFETGPDLSSQGVALAVMDRRGSGRSGGSRGDITRFEQWVDDYVNGLERVADRYAGLPVLLLGQSMGGKIATGVALHPRAKFDAFLLCASGLGQLRSRMTADEQAQLLASEPDALREVHFKDEWYTRDPQYLRFMREDPYMVRKVTNRLRIEELRLEAFIAAGTVSTERTPSWLVIPRVDPIIRLPAAKDAFRRLTSDQGVVLEVPVEDHYVEFTPWRAHYVRFLSTCASSVAFSRSI
jgi:alpha-beta hydrolase superfamily lysophospholipase